MGGALRWWVARHGGAAGGRRATPLTRAASGVTRAVGAAIARAGRPPYRRTRAHPATHRAVDAGVGATGPGGPGRHRLLRPVALHRAAAAAARRRLRADGVGGVRRARAGGGRGVEAVA